MTTDFRKAFLGGGSIGERAVLALSADGMLPRIGETVRRPVSHESSSLVRFEQSRKT